MRLKFHGRVVLYAAVIGFIVTCMTILLASLFTSPDSLIFIGPASFFWIVILAFIARRVASREE